MRRGKGLISLSVIICLIAGVVIAEGMSMASAAGKTEKNIRLKVDNRNISHKTISMQKGKKQKVKVVVPKKQKAKFTFRSNKRNIVSVSKTGKLTAKKAGSAKITVVAKTKKKRYTSWVKIRVLSSLSPTPTPEVSPSAVPTASPTPTPEVSPSAVPTASPTPTPEVSPSAVPTASPTTAPTTIPSFSPSPDTGEESNMYDITLQINGQSFSAKLYKTETTEQLMQKLPLSITMSELNGNEKYYYFSESFPTDAERVSQIHAGDIKLYGSSCLVLFYESFSTSYSYTSLGYVENPESLADVLGTGNVQVNITG